MPQRTSFLNFSFVLSISNIEFENKTLIFTSHLYSYLIIVLQTNAGHEKVSIWIQRRSGSKFIQPEKLDRDPKEKFVKSGNILN